MDVSLTPDLERFVQEQIEGGRYHSASEVFRAALRFFQAQELVQQLRSEKLRQEIQVGLDQARQGDVAPLDLEAIKAKGREILQTRASGAGRA